MPEPLAPPGYTTHESGLFLPVDLRADALSDLTSPTAWMLDAFTTGRVHSGQAVSPQSSMGLAAYYACLNVIAQDCAKLPLPLYRELDRGREKVREHPLWHILQYRFNTDMTAYIGRYVLTHHAVGWGNGYGLILRDRSFGPTDGQVTGIYPIHPSRVRVERDNATRELVYDISQMTRFPREPGRCPGTGAGLRHAPPQRPEWRWDCRVLDGSDCGREYRHGPGRTGVWRQLLRQ